MLQTCSLSQDRKKFSCIGQGTHIVLQILNWSQELTHGCRIPLLLHRQFINFFLSGFICFFATDSSQCLNFLAISCEIFLEDLFHIFNSPKENLFSLSLICPLIRLIKLQSLRFKFSIDFIGSYVSTDLFSISSVHFCLRLR